MMPESCIYCSSRNDWSREHCLPLGLGTFKGHHILQNTVCHTCNEKISRAEEQFLRASPEAYFRYHLGIKGRKYHAKTSPFYRGSSGAPPLMLKLKHPEADFDALWEIVPGTHDLREIRQIFMRKKGGETIPIPLPPKIKASDDIKIHIAKYGIEEGEPIAFYTSPEDWNDLLSMIQEIWPKKGVLEKIPPKAADEKILAAIRIRVTSMYFRAVAKIGFHYFLSIFSSQFSGEEPGFAPIRSFILDGNGQSEDFVLQTRQQMIFNLNQGYTTNRWGHCMAAAKEDNSLTSSVQFFVGPEYLPPVYEINIGKNPCRLIHRERYGHFYAYFYNKKKEGYDGEVTTMQSLDHIII